MVTKLLAVGTAKSNKGSSIDLELGDMESEPESPPHPKTEYELFRDMRKAEVDKAIKPVLCAKKQL